MANNSSAAEPTSSKSIVAVVSGDGIKEARNGFARAVSVAITDLMNDRNVNRETATLLVLQEIGDTTSPQPEEKLNHVKLRYRLAHQPATRALAVSTALQRILRDERLSHAQAIQQLTQKLAAAHFSDTAASAVEIGEQVSFSMRRKKSEISLPELPKTQQPTRRSKSPSKRGKTQAPVSPSPSTKATKQISTAASSSRKRSIDELGGTSGQQQTPLERNKSKVVVESRPRTDSVTEEVTAKMEQQPATTTASPDKTTAPSARNKRVRGGGAVEEMDGGVVSAKRTRAG